MGSGIYTAMSGAVAQSNSLDVHANNLANASTVCHKQQRVSFQQLLTQEQQPSREMAMTNIAQITTDTSSGALIQTNNPLDLALVGEGFFAVDTDRGVRYTRAGDFRLSDAGTLINGAGFSARAQGGGTITIPDGVSSVTVDGTGRVYADKEEVGQLELAVFAPENVTREGGNLFSANGQQTGGDNPEVLAGSLEGSNVNPVRGMVELVKVTRSYQALLRMVETYKRLDERTARSLGRAG